MVEDAYTKLEGYLKDTAGDYLRGIAVYHGDDYNLKYIRDDLRAHRLESEVETMVDRLREESLGREQRSFPFGGLNGIVRSFNDAMVMHFPQTQERGIVVTLEPEVARQLNTFLGECLHRIHN